ncbi:MAG TPA: DUF4920 domain-containing protein [Oligoflexus sp.]|uniref:DUF4920 domain-containing protein n=1 Tax=Oligoflexus sp. TaxID=1971216 RepID=UPI002D3E5CA9|nr:DUF4920 domain-containing protein [Oligoflexus sp.]HYX33762.1 DUF4920 domain-containing protein [Oligoflexus sp.]
MKKIILPFSLVLSFSMAHAAENFGKLTLAESSARPLKSVVAEYKEGSATPVLVKGTVKKVCEKEGCWMTLEDGGEQVRVFFKNHSFVVTNKLKDKTALAEGLLTKKVRSVSDQKHLLKDAGESAQAIDAVKADKIFYEFEATGIKAL